MPIKPTASAEIRALLSALRAKDNVTRESAIARLAIIGPRAVDKILADYPAADRDTQIGMLRALEAIADPRALNVARQALTQGGDLAVAAAATLRPLLNAPGESAAADALDALVAAVLDRSGERRVRLAAVDALRDMPPHVRDQVADALKEDPDPTVQAQPATSSADAATHAVWQDAVEERLPEDPAGLRAALETHSASAPLGVLQKMVDAIRAREAGLPVGPRRDAWLGVRGALHQALALRGSSIAIYDLRETFIASDRALPSSFLMAVHAVGDESCLEALAMAYENASGRGAEPEADRWRHQLGSAFEAVLAREKGARRATLLKRIAARWPAAAEAFSTTSRTTPRPKRRSRT